MFCVKLVINLATICGLIEATSLRPRQDNLRTPWVKISYCNSDQENEIHEAALEAELAMSIASERLQLLRPYNSHQPIPPIQDMTLKFRSTVETYSCLIDRGLLENWEEQDAPNVYARLYELIKSIDRVLLIRMRNEPLPKAEITCGESWIGAKRDFAAWLGHGDQYFDNRLSVDSRTPRHARWIELPEYRPFVGADRRVSEAKLYHDMCGPLTDVLALKHRGSLWRYSRGPFKSVANGIEVEASSLEQIRSTTYAPGTWRLQDIFKQSLTGVLLKYFCQMGTLAAMAAREPLSFFTLEQDVTNYDDWNNVTAVAQRNPDVASSSAENFAYLVIALYLDNADWTTGVNR